MDLLRNRAATRRNSIWLALAACGAVAFWLALDFGLGTARNIGSGIFPLALSALMIVISVVSFLFPRAETSEPFSLRPLLAVSGSVVLFIILVERTGMFPAILLSMLAAFLAQTKRDYRPFLIYAAVFAAGVWFIFAYALGVPVAFVRTP